MRTLACLVLTALTASALADGFTFQGPGTPIPRPANPYNNPWLNYPTHYGRGAPVHDFNDAASTEVVSNLDRFLKLSGAERKNLEAREEGASRARGQALYNDARLGSNGLTCAACHPGGQSAGGKVGVGNHEVDIASLVDVARRYPRYKATNGRVITQTEMQNNCIQTFMKGPPLASGTRDAADLTYYVSGFMTVP